MAASTPNVEEGRASQLEQLRSKLGELDDEILTLTSRALTPDEEERYADLCAERDATWDEFKPLQERAERADQIRKSTYRELRGIPEPHSALDEVATADISRIDGRAARDGALRILGDRESAWTLTPNQHDVLEKLVRKDPDAATRIMVTETPAYRSAFHKLMTDPSPVFTHEEHTAMLRYKDYERRYEARAQSTTVGSGGYAIPVFIDPSFILTDQETDNPFLRLCRIVDINTGTWKGVSGAGVSWSFDTEASAVSDDAVTLAQPTVTVFTARGFIPYSIEIGEDWPGFQSEMARLLASGYDELLISKFTTGNGTSEPRGLITALDANSATRYKATTAGAFGQEDVYRLWRQLPQKYRRAAAWMSSVDINNRVRQMGSVTNWHAQTVQLPAGSANALMEKPWYENAYMADFTSTTTLSANLLVVGDFSNYVIARRSGMTVEFVPNLFDTASGRPTGSRGWFAHARIGGNSVNDSAFRMLVNTNGN